MYQKLPKLTRIVKGIVVISRLFFIVSGLMLILVSCEKEPSNENGIVPPTQLDDSTLLSMYVILTTQPNDTASKVLFTYDSKRRNTGIEIVDFSDGVVTRQYKSSFFYNGNDTLPFKKVAVSPFLQPTDQDYINETCYYYYDKATLTTDSTIQNSQSLLYTIVNTYEYQVDRIINNVTTYYDEPTTIYTNSDTIYLTYRNGNIIKQVEAPFSIDFTFAYDSHPNPFNRTQYKIVLDNRWPYYFMETLIPEIFGNNNAVEVKQSFGVHKFHHKNTYEYKENGYPKKVDFVDQNDLSQSWTGIYFYTK